MSSVPGAAPPKAKFIIGEAKKQYGLVLPGASGGSSAATTVRRTGRVAAAFGDDDDDDDDNNNGSDKPVPLVRTAAASSTNRMAQAAQSAALAEDAAAFEYDSLYDSMKAKQKAANKAARKDASREPKYIKQLLAKAEERKRDDELYYEKKLMREQAEEMAEFGETEKFLTSAYRKKMEENRLWREEKERRDAEIDSRGIAAQGSSALLANIINDRLADDDASDAEPPKRAAVAVEQHNDDKSEQQQQQQNVSSTDEATTTTTSTTHVAFAVSKKRPAESVPLDLGNNVTSAPTSESGAPVIERRETQGWSAATVSDKSLAERQKEALTIDSHHDKGSVMSARERYLARKKQRGDGAAAANDD